jgi:hypothetical protein
MLCNRLSQQAPVKLIERATDVALDNPIVRPTALSSRSYRIHGGFSSLIPVRVRVKDPIKVCSDSRHHDLLRDPVGNCGHS